MSTTIVGVSSNVIDEALEKISRFVQGRVILLVQEETASVGNVFNDDFRLGNSRPINQSSQGVFYLLGAYKIF
jgi:hypothetical protein